ncbi:MAG TPA: lysine--tRNA ligase [Bryobacteraceae bacterium]
MHWADKVADSLMAQYPSREEFHFASGTTPSGPVHCGNLRDILTNWFVAECLIQRGRRVRLIHSWDDYDRFRKVPKGVPPDYEQHLGKPVADVPDPWGEYSSYAERYEKIFERSLPALGITLDYRYQAAMYRSRQYNSAIIEAIGRRYEIYDIISSFRTQKGDRDERELYYPVEVYCPVCHRDTTRLLEFNETTLDFHYRCKCGHEGSGNARTADNLKLPWKVDWAMRWRHEDIIFEPGGKDHGTAGGSYEVSSRIAREVFGKEPPVFQVYEFVGIKGLSGKMSGSVGTVITLEEALAIYQPEILLWMFSRMAPNRAFDLVLDRQIFQIYDEFDRAAAGTDGIEADLKAIELSRVAGRSVRPIPFRQLASFSGIVRGNRKAMADIFRRLGTPYSPPEFAERLEKAENWLRTWAPEEDVRLSESKRVEYFTCLPADRKAWINALKEWVSSEREITVETANQRLYDIPQSTNGASGDQRRLQKTFFTDIYQLLFARDSGPRLATFLAAVPKEDYLSLIDFTAVAA